MKKSARYLKGILRLSRRYRKSQKLTTDKLKVSFNKVLKSSNKSNKVNFDDSISEDSDVEDERKKE